MIHFENMENEIIGEVWVHVIGEPKHTFLSICISTER